MSSRTSTLFTVLSRDKAIREMRELTGLIYSEKEPYRVSHLKLTDSYARRLASNFPRRLNSQDRYRLRYASLSHDLLKGKHFDPNGPPLEIRGHSIPQDLNRYVRLNLPILQEFDLDDYFNTDIQLHALASGLFLIMELGERDPRVLYPVFFHSCPILPVYESLDETTRLLVDIIVLADKLSSNHLKLQAGKKVALNLELAVFGESGQEFNFTQGLYLARLIGQGSSTEEYSKLMTEHYYQRLVRINPIMGNFKKSPTL